MRPDGTIEGAHGYLQPLTWAFDSALSTQILTANYLVPSAVSPNSIGNTVSYHNNNTLWEMNNIRNSHYHGQRILLDSFFVFEWIPRSPGLYFTYEGYSARKKAKESVVSIINGTVTYDPYGKQSMLDGGVGALRLRPINIRGIDWIFGSASDNGICHQGFPIAMPMELYLKYVDEIKNRGVICCDVIGVLKHIPENIDDLYHGFTGVKKLYLEVEEIRTPRQIKSRTLAELDVSVAICFEGIFEGQKGIFAAYKSFDPGRKDDLASTVSWLQNEYVSNYKGKVLTDFDQQENHFNNARFRLDKIMNLKISRRDLDLLHNDTQIERYIQYQQTIYNISGGNIGAVGDGAKAFNNNISKRMTGRSKRKIKGG